MFFDIHSHILPGVDDGAQDLEESLKLLKMMKKSGISNVIATSHFYPEEVNYDVYLEVTRESFKELEKATNGKGLPKIYYGCEMLYYRGIGNSEVLNGLCLNGSKYLLLELTDFDINDYLFEDIINLKTKQGITPIIAHVERYYKAKNFKKLLKFLEKNNVPVQINAASVMIKPLRKTLKEIFSMGLFCVIATDTHSSEERPPLMSEAYVYIRDNFSPQLREKLARNSKKLAKEIIGENFEK